MKVNFLGSVIEHEKQNLFEKPKDGWHGKYMEVYNASTKEFPKIETTRERVKEYKPFYTSDTEITFSIGDHVNINNKTVYVEEIIKNLDGSINYKTDYIIENDIDKYPKTIGDVL